MRNFYTLMFYLALPFILLRLLMKACGNKAYLTRWHECLGFNYPVVTNKPHIWIHTVSMGEALAAIPLIKKLQAMHPQYAFVITATTPTGYQQIKQHLQNTVACVYTPLDIPWILYKFIKHFNVKTCIIVEREMWPNLIAICHKKNISVAIVNARMSERSKNNYQKIPRFMRHMLNQITLVLSQSLDVSQRLEQLGLHPDKIKLCGNIKFDITIPQSKIEEGLQLKKSFKGRPVFIAASTHAGEEAIILQAYSLLLNKINNLLLILVPRHPARFNKVAQLCHKHDFTLARHSLHETVTPQTHIYLGDTVGDLIMLYAASDIAFVGGSLTPIGGHNLLEPAAVGKPMITGPYLQNYIEISELLKTAKALSIVNTPQDIANHVVNILNTSECYARMQQNGRQVVSNNRGALDKHISNINDILQTI